MVAARRAGASHAQRSECTTRRVRLYERGNGASTVPGEAATTGRRFPGILAPGAAAVSRLASDDRARQRQQPYGSRRAGRSASARCPAAVAADARAGAGPDGHAVGARQGCHLREQAVHLDRRAGRCLHRSRQQLVESGSAANVGCAVEAFLAQACTGKELLFSCLGNVAASVKRYG